MKKLLLIAGFGLLVSSSHASLAATTPIADMPAGIYEADDSHTSVTWKVNHLGLSNYTARFARVKATLNLDPKDITKSSVVAVIDPTSIKTDYPHVEKKDFDAKLIKDAEWFNAGVYPEIKFVSTSVEKTGDKTGKIHGNLSMLGVTKPLTLDVVFNGAYAKMPFKDVPAIGFSATTVVKRSDWGFSAYVPNIGDEVMVAIEIEFNQLTAANK